MKMHPLKVEGNIIKTKDLNLEHLKEKKFKKRKLNRKTGYWFDTLQRCPNGQ